MSEKGWLCWGTSGQDNTARFGRDGHISISKTVHSDWEIWVHYPDSFFKLGYGKSREHAQERAWAFVVQEKKGLKYLILFRKAASVGINATAWEVKAERPTAPLARDFARDSVKISPPGVEYLIVERNYLYTTPPVSEYKMVTYDQEKST